MSLRVSFINESPRKWEHMHSWSEMSIAIQGQLIIPWIRRFINIIKNNPRIFPNKINKRGVETVLKEFLSEQHETPTSFSVSNPLWMNNSNSEPAWACQFELNSFPSLILCLSFVVPWSHYGWWLNYISMSRLYLCNICSFVLIKLRHSCFSLFNTRFSATSNSVTVVSSFIWDISASSHFLIRRSMLYISAIQQTNSFTVPAA